MQFAVVVDEVGLCGAGQDAHDFAGEQVFAGDLHLGVFADEMAILAGDANSQLDLVAGRFGRDDRFDFAGVHALDADAGAGLDAVDVVKAGVNVEAAVAPAGAFVEDQQGAAAEAEREHDPETEPSCLGTR